MLFSATFLHCLCFFTIVEDVVDDDDDELLDVDTAVAAPIDLPEVTNVVSVVELDILRPVGST